MTSRPPLPASWVDRIFAKLIGVYGQEFLGKFTLMADGSNMGLEIAKRTWAQDLAGFGDQPTEGGGVDTSGGLAIAYALEHLPEKAPNLIEFRALCRQAPKAELPKLERKWTPEELRANRAKVAQIIAGLNLVSPSTTRRAGKQEQPASD